jgi:hypothetical protein
MSSQAKFMRYLKLSGKIDKRLKDNVKKAQRIAKILSNLINLIERDVESIKQIRKTQLKARKSEISRSKKDKCVTHNHIKKSKEKY